MTNIKGNFRSFLYFFIFLTVGVYFPVTMEGSIVVDGVLASCYALINHDLSHLMLTPIRWFPGLTGWIFGEDDGISGFAEVLADLGGLGLPFGQIMTDMN